MPIEALEDIGQRLFGRHPKSTQQFASVGIDTQEAHARVTILAVVICGRRERHG
ncbi:hypothetical protein ACVOMS_11890 [Bradyrhizobium guangxiense]